MKQILKLVFLLVIGQTTFAQAPSNYTNINGRYRWIAGMFDSTFHIPKGSTPSLRTGGSTNAGALFYRTSDSTVRYWTGSQWLTLSDTTRFVPYVGATKDVDLDTWSLYAKSLHIKGTAGQGHLGLKFQSATPNMSANESGVYADASGNFGIKIDNAYTSIFKTNLNSADRTYTFQNKSYTVADSADVAAKIDGTLISGYLTKATGTKTIDTSQIYQTNGKIGIGKTNPTAKVDITDSLGTALRVTNIGPYGVGGDGINVRVNGWSGYAALIEQRDSSAAGTQYQTVFRKGMLPGYGNPAPGGGVAFITQIGGENEVYKNLTVYRGRMIDSTGYSVGQVKGTSQEIWTRKNGVWDTTLVLNQGNVGVNTGQNGIDSALTVANGTWLKRGVRMSALPTGVGTKSVRIDANGTLSVADTLANGVSGSGTTNYVSKFTGTNAIGNSQIFDNGSAVGINTITPASGIRLDVNGNIQAKNEITVQGRDSDGLGTIWLNDVSSSFSYLQGVPSNDEFRFWVRSNGKYKFSIDNTEMIRVNTTGVGIGTTTPDSLLTVNLGTHLKRGVRLSGLPTGAGTKSLRVDANGTVSIADTLANGISGSGTTNYIPKFTGSTSIGNSNFITDASGNLGIGAVSLGSGLRLYVVQASGEGNPTLDGSEVALFQRNFVSAQSSSIAITSGSASTSSLYFGDKDNVSIGKLVYDNSSNAMIFNTNGSEGMRLTSAGSLGLGTSSPIEKFTSNGLIAITGPAATAYYVGNNNSAFLDYNSGDTRIGSQSSAGNSLISFHTTSSGYTGITERMRLDASGNLGLGTSSPAYKLDVNGTGNFAGDVNIQKNQNGTTALNIYNTTSGTVSDVAVLLNSNTTSGTSVLGKKSSGVTTYKIFTPSAAYWYNGTAGDIAILNDFGSGAIKMSAGGSSTAQLTLDASGNLGLGVTPSAWSGGQALQVTSAALWGFNNNAHILANAYYNSGFKYLANGVAALYEQNTGQHIWYNAPSGTAGNAISFTQAMTLDASGRLGIGTTSPNTILQANFSSATAYSSGATGNGLTLYNTNTTNNQYVGLLLQGEPTAGNAGQATIYGITTGSGAMDMAFSTRGSSVLAERMRITSGGNVGIGTTNPLSPLQVNGIIRVNASSGNGYQIFDGNTERMHIYHNSSIGGIEINTGATTNATMSFYVNGNNAIFINSSGNVGIGTTSPSQKLEVNGAIKTAAPSAGNAAAWKLGERVASAGVTFNDQQYIQLDIAGTTYYLATVDLPMPEAYPQATSGPSNNYKMAPVQVRTTKDVEIEKLRKEIEELKQLIKNK